MSLAMSWEDVGGNDLESGNLPIIVHQKPTKNRKVIYHWHKRSFRKKGSVNFTSIEKANSEVISGQHEFMCQ